MCTFLFSGVKVKFTENKIKVFTMEKAASDIYMLNNQVQVLNLNKKMLRQQTVLTLNIQI